MYDDNLKNNIVSKARELGADIVGVCSVESWKNEPLQSPEFWPQNIWPWAKTVIVMAIPLLYPMGVTAPSMVFKEQYDTSNRITDNLAYYLAKYIMAEKHYRAMFFPRDCYDGMEALLRHEAAAFSHVVAGYYAGVGTIGDSHNLITAQFGPRIRLVSVITDAPIRPDNKIKKDLCIHCKKCLKCCPSKCFTENREEELSGLYGFDRDKCTLYHIELIKQHRFPCGYCATFCPVGEDVKMYASVDAVSEAGKKHCQTYGS